MAVLHATFQETKQMLNLWMFWGTPRVQIPTSIFFMFHALQYLSSSHTRQLEHLNDQ